MPQGFSREAGVHEMLGEALDRAPSLALPLRAATKPLTSQRSQIRDLLARRGTIHQLPTDEGTYLSLAAVDGAHTWSPMFIGDQINVLALAVKSELRTGSVSITGHQGINEFLPHSPDNEGFAKAAMMAAELDLMAQVSADETVTVVDGSHSTAVTAIIGALATGEGPAHDYIASDAISDQVIAAVESLADRECVIACPKSDSSTEIGEFLRGEGIELPMRFPDKVVASLVLDPGEVLAFEGSQVPWGRSEVMSDRITSDDGRALRDRIASSCQTLKEGLRVAHVKPLGSATAIRVETKASLDAFETADFWQAIADDCEPPHTQEPVAQYIADHLAKNVSEVAKVQLDSARLDLAETGDDALVEYLLRSYRTT